MKNNISTFILFLGMIGLFSSCEDYLNQTNPNGSDADSYWQNLSQTSTTLSAAYSTLLNKNIIAVREESWRSDLAVPGYGRPSWKEPGGPWHFQDYNNENMIRLRWEALYNGIFRANQVIGALEALRGTVDEDELVLQMAQARFLRGLFHFYLHSSYNKGNVMIKDNVPGSLDDFNTPVSTAEQVASFFYEDLRYAYENLPYDYDESDKGRATKGAAAAILGNSFLYQNKIDSAMTYYNDLLDNSQYGYELVRDASLLFTNAGAFNKESILEINYSTTVRPEINIWANDAFVNQWASYATSFSHSQSYFPSMWLSWEYLNEPMDSKDPRNFYTDNNGEEHAKPVSLRASAMVALAVDTITPYYQTIAIEKAAFNKNNGVSRFKHYTNHDIYESESENPLGNWASGKNVTINRLGEIYVNLAECYVYKNDISRALELINAVRMRWGLQLIGTSGGDSTHDYDEVIYTQESLLKRIQDIEKPLETSIEGYSTRWIDLRRWNITKENFENKFALKFWAKEVVYKGKTYWANTITDEDPDNPNIPMYQDFEQAVKNFNYENNAWFPIPNSEEVSNPSVND